MNTGQRIALLVAAVVLLAGGFALAQGAGDDEGAEATTTQTETTAVAPDATTETPTATQTPAEEPAPGVETIRIRSGQPAGTGALLTKLEVRP